MTDNSETFYSLTTEDITLNNLLVIPVKSVEGNVGANTWIGRTQTIEILK